MFFFRNKNLLRKIEKLENTVEYLEEERDGLIADLNRATTSGLAHKDHISETHGWSIEPHGGGWAVYFGRDYTHHGVNLGQIVETSEENVKKIENSLNTQTKWVSCSERLPRDFEGDEKGRVVLLCFW